MSLTGDIEFFSYGMFDVASLNCRERYQDHDKETLGSVIGNAQTIAETSFLKLSCTVLILKSTGQN
jgi:hypothetical protein